MLTLAQPKLSLGRELALISAVGAGTFTFAFQVAALFVVLPSMAETSSRSGAVARWGGKRP
jgi:hypothetical protein